MPILRISQASGIQASGARAAPMGDDPVKKYVEKLVLLIPAEVVALYLAGKAVIVGNPPVAPTKADLGYWAGWAIFCLVAVIAVRIWATSDRQAGIKPQWPAVAIAAVSFIIWVYSFGDVFVALGNGLWSARTAGLTVLAWTFIVPLLYSGDTPAVGPINATAQRRQFRSWATERLSGALLRTPPADFSEDDAEEAVIAGAHDLHVAVSLSDTISDRFGDADEMGMLLASIQDVIRGTHGIWVDLTGQPPAEVEKLRTKSYDNLALWTHSKVGSTGQPLSTRQPSTQV